MSKHLDHEKRNRKRTAEDVVNKISDHVSTSKLLQSNDNLMQQNWLSNLLSRPELDDYQKKSVQESLEWLRAVSTRRLGFSWQAKYRRFEYVCDLKKEGRYTPPSEEKVAEAKKRAALRAARYQENKPKFPDWVQDKSLLPKKPPKRSE